MKTAKTAKQGGVALIIVLLIVALATSVAAYMTAQQNLWQRQVQSQLDRAQARHIGAAAIDWARAVLADDLRTSSSDNAQEMWAARLPAMPVENGEVSGAIEDRQGLFNLNNIVRNGAISAPHLDQYKRLLEILGLPPELGAALADWMDADSETYYPGGAEDVYYLSLEHPYRTANRPLAEIGELALVRGYDSSVIERLRPYVTTLPEPGAINVNFAPPEVLAAVANMSLADARMVAQQRESRPYKDLDDFKTRMPNKGTQVDANDLDVNSHYFMVTGRASVGDAQVVTEALLKRSGGWPQVVWQNVQ